jgi:hypothetical protein
VTTQGDADLRVIAPLSEGELRHALEDEHGASTLMVRRLAHEVLRVRALIGRDRTGLAGAIDCMVKEASGRVWVAEGRGCYEWDDDRYKEEAGEALRAVIAIGKKALNDSGTLADQAFHPRPPVTPKDWTGMSGIDVWEALKSAPKVAGPWESGGSGEMAVRRAFDGELIATELWVAPTRSWRVSAGDRAIADDILTKHGWLLAGPTYGSVTPKRTSTTEGK